jgi:hypothetical protein
LVAASSRRASDDPAATLMIESRGTSEVAPTIAYPGSDPVERPEP